MRNSNGFRIQPPLSALVVMASGAACSGESTTDSTSPPQPTVSALPSVGAPASSSAGGAPPGSINPPPIAPTASGAGGRASTVNPPTASAGSTATAGGAGGASAGAGGEAAAGSANEDKYQPLCETTKAEAGYVRGGMACTAADPPQCYDSCGPEVGFRQLSCVGGSYAAGECEFPPDEDYSCFAIPEALSSECPTDAPPRHNQECRISECTPCNLDGTYIAGSRDTREGWCVCNDFGVWRCSGAFAWPCPAGNGCQQ